MESGNVGRYGATVKITTSDTAQGLSNNITTSGDYDAIALNITVETYAVRVAYGGTTPVVGATGLGHYYKVDDKFRIVGIDNVRSAKFINYVSGQNGVMIITPEF
jgi:hypothetical protein